MNTTTGLEENSLCRRESFYDGLRKGYTQRYRSFDGLAVRVVHDLVQTFGLLEARMASCVHEHGVTLPGLNVLTILRGHGVDGCPLNALSQLLLVSRANITGLIDGLARKHLVKRVDHATDRRVVLAKITKEGEKWLDHYMPVHCAELRAMLAGLSAPEKTQLAALLTKLRHTSCQNSRPQTVPSTPKKLK